MNFARLLAVSLAALPFPLLAATPHPVTTRVTPTPSPTPTPAMHGMAVPRASATPVAAIRAKKATVAVPQQAPRARPVQPTPTATPAPAAAFGSPQPTQIPLVDIKK